MKKSYLLVPLFMLFACSSTDDEVVKEAPIEELYTQAYNFYKQGSYKRSIKYFQAIERLYPYSDWTIKAQIMMGYLQYLKKEYTQAIDTFKLFVEIYPNHKDAAYANYMIGMCYYRKVSKIERDQTFVFNAIEYFSEVVNKYPNSKYAKDSLDKITILRNHIAFKTKYIGRFYQSVNSYGAAINRYLYVIENHKESPCIPETLFRLYESYNKLGLNDQAEIFSNRLKKEFPNNEWSMKIK